jgi:hypothetical protein
MADQMAVCECILVSRWLLLIVAALRLFFCFLLRYAYIVIYKYLVAMLQRFRSILQCI